MTPPIWEYYIQRDGTLRYHFRDFVDYLGEQLPPGTITIFELFNEIWDCNGFGNPSGILLPGVQCTESIHHQGYIDFLENPADCGITRNRWDYFEVLALPSERAPSALCPQCTGPGVTAENKAQIWCELALRARVKWGFPAAAYNDYDISPDSGGARATYALQVTRAIAGTTLTPEQRQSLLGPGLYDSEDDLQCINAIDVIGMQ